MVNADFEALTQVGLCVCQSVYPVAWLPACLCARARACEFVCVRVRACMRACMCVRACVRACIVLPSKCRIIYTVVESLARVHGCRGADEARRCSTVDATFTKEVKNAR
jgi:hypothetical protein